MMMDQATLPNMEQMRKAMVASQLRTNTVNDPAVIAAAREHRRPEAILAEYGAAGAIHQMQGLTR